MNLWLSSHFLVAGLFLSSWALTPEECQPLVKPLSLDDPSMMFGRWNFITGYTNSEIYNALVNLTHSSWMNITASPTSSREVVMVQHDNINGTCMTSTVNVPIDHNTLSALFANITSVFHLLPSCENCLLMSVNSTARNLDKTLKQMNISNINAGDELHAYGLYLMAKDSTLKDSDLEHFKKQASCFGFSRELDFRYDPTNPFCDEHEGIDLTAILN